MNTVLAGISEHAQYTVTKISKIKVPHQGLRTPVYRLTVLRCLRKRQGQKRNHAKACQSLINCFSDSEHYASKALHRNDTGMVLRSCPSIISFQPEAQRPLRTHHGSSRHFQGQALHLPLSHLPRKLQGSGGFLTLTMPNAHSIH